MLYSFDQFVLDTDRFEISKDGCPLRAEPQVVELLTYLVSNSGRLVTRDELAAAVWNGRLVSDAAISGRIKLARRLLGDSGRQQKYIRTIHKKGFSFVAETRVETGGKSAEFPRPAAAAPNSGEPRGRRHAARPSLGVVKFNNLGDQGGRHYFADGLTEELITTLSKISKLIVVACPESMQAEGDAVDARHVGEIMDVRYVLHGNVRSDSDRLRISVHLVDSLDARHLWAQRYDRGNAEIFDLQDELTREVVSALQVELTEGDQALLLCHGTQNFEAWQLTFEGQAGVLAHHQHSVRRGLRQLERAVELDPDYALAWSALAVAHWKEALNQGWSDSREVSLTCALEASDRALALDPDNAGILAMHSLVLVTQRRFDAAQELALRALNSASSAADTIALAGITLRACCQPRLSILHTRKAMQLCPVYPAWYVYGISVCQWMLGDPANAVETAHQAIAIDPEFSLSYLLLALVHAESGRRDEARAAVTSLLAIDPKFSSRAYIRGLPFRDPAIEARRVSALARAGMPE